MDFWLRVNNVDVPNSNIRYTSLHHEQKDIAVLQQVISLAKTDIVNIMMSVEDLESGLGIETIEPEGEPLIPSIIFTMYQLE